MKSKVKNKKDVYKSLGIIKDTDLFFQWICFHAEWANQENKSPLRNQFE